MRGRSQGPDRSSATHVVLVHPEIHWNTGNAGRTCLATGATLHLIEPLGFSLDEREVKRAGLDYWEHIDLRVWPSWDAFEKKMRHFVEVCRDKRKNESSGDAGMAVQKMLDGVYTSAEKGREVNIE